MLFARHRDNALRMPALVLLFLSAPILATPVEAAELAIALEWVNGRPTAQSAEPTVTVSARRNPDLEPQVYSLYLESDTVLELEPGVRWRVQVEAEGFWAAEQSVRLGNDGARIEVPLWPAGVLEGRLSVASGDSLPTRLSARLTSADDRETGRSPDTARVMCPVEDGNFWCVAPEGAYDLVLDSGRHAPVRRWGVQVRSRRSPDLGEIQLLSGASVVGFVTTGQDESLPSGLEIMLTDSTAPASPPPGAEPEEPLFTALVLPEGFFQFTGVPRGSYVATIRSPDFLPTASEPFEVGKRREVLLNKPLIASRSATLDLIFYPPVDPFDEIWSFELIRVDPLTGGAVEVRQLEADESGRWFEEQMRSSKYQLRLRGEINPHWVVRRFELGPSQPPIQINIGIVGVTGTVRAGENPIAAEVELRPETGSRITLTADAGGEFRGYLPAEGRWDVTVQAFGRRIQHRTVNVQASPFRSVTNIDIELPATSISGQVVDDRDYPIQGAAVVIRWANGDSPDITVLSDENGNFEAQGLPPGQIMLRANLGAAGSQLWTLAQLAPDQQNVIPPLRISGLPEQ